MAPGSPTVGLDTAPKGGEGERKKEREKGWTGRAAGRGKKEEEKVGGREKIEREKEIIK